MARRKSSRPLIVITLRLYEDQVEDVADFYPQVPKSEMFRRLIDAALKPVKTRRAEIENERIK